MSLLVYLRLIFYRVHPGGNYMGNVTSSTSLPIPSQLAGSLLLFE